MTAQSPASIDGSQPTASLRLRMLGYIAAALLALMPGIAIAEMNVSVDPVPVLLLVPDDGVVHSSFADGFSACFGSKGSTDLFYNIKTIKHVQANPELLATHRVVAIGAKSSGFMHRHGDAWPFVSALIPESVARELLGAGAETTGPAAFFLLDQPLSRRLSLTRTLLPMAEKLSVVLGPDSAHLAEELIPEANRFGFAVDVVVLKSGEELPKVTEGLFDSSDGLFLVYDPILTSSRLIRFLLYSAYQNKVPVFGYSEGYVKAGALAAVYSTSEGLGCQVGEYMTEHPRFPVGDLGWKKPPVFYPEYFRYGVNPSVAASLGIRIDDLPENHLAKPEKQ